jgi:nucleotide-binding universal stress UspA family protein
MPRPVPVPASVTVGVDGSPESLAALAWAGREAVRRGAVLRVLHVWEPERRLGALFGDVEPGDQEQWARQGLRGAVDEITARHPELTVTCDMYEGDAVGQLLAASADARMLVLGSRGHGAVVGFLLGSVGQQVLVGADCPVVSVRADDRATGEAAGREIVVGQQGEPEDSAAALRFAFETAAARGASVRVVRAWSLPPVFAYSPASLRLLDEAGGLEPYEKAALATAVEPWRDRFPGVRVAEHVEMGSAGQVLLSVAGSAQLLVVGRRAHRSAVGARIGSVTYGVLHHADCPVAVVPPGGDSDRSPGGDPAA